MADQNLNVTINADASSVGPAIVTSEQLTAAIEGIEKTLAALAAASSTATASTTALADSHRAAAAATASHAEAETILGATVGKVEAATNAAARAFSAIGFSTGEATERVEGLTEALDGVGKAALPLLAVGAAILGLAATFNVLRDGIKDAADTQVAMASLGQAVINQGGAWSEATQNGVDRFLSAIEAATTYTRGEALAAINSLVTAGTSLADSEKIVAIATDVAAGSHRSLQDVVDRLKEAEAGRGMGLVELDTKLKNLVHTHADLSTILTQLSNDFSGEAAAAAATFEGRSEQLRNQLAHVAEELGEKLLPALTVGTEILIGFADEAESHIPQVESFFDTVVNDAMRAYNAMVDFGSSIVRVTTLLGDIQHLNIGATIKDAQGLSGGITGDATDAVMQIFGGPGAGAGPRRTPATDFFQAALDRANKERAEADAELNAEKAQALQRDMQVGEPGRGENKEPFDFDPETDQIKTDKYAESQKQLDQWLKQNVAGEKAFEDAVKEASNETFKQADSLGLAKQQSADAEAAVTKLTAAIATESAQRKSLQTDLATEKTDYETLLERYNAYGAAIGKSPTPTEKANLGELRREMEAALATYNATNSSINTLTSNIDRNTDSLAHAKDNTHAYAIALDEADRTARKLTEDVSAWVDKQNADYQKTFVQPVVNLDDEKSTYNKSIAQQIAYYEARMAMLDQTNAEQMGEWEKYYDKVLSLEFDDYKQRIDQHDAFMEKLKTSEATILDDIVTKHDSFRDALKEIWRQISEDAEKNFIGGLLGGATQKGDGSTTGGGIFGGLNSFISSIFGGGTASSQNAQAAPSAIVNPLDAIQANTAAIAAHAANSLLDSPGSNPITDLGQNTLSQIINPTTDPQLFNYNYGADAEGINPTTDPQLYGISSGGSTSASGGGLSGLLGGFGQGAGIGGLVGSLDGGNSGIASIAGGLAGMLKIGGPYGALIGTGIDVVASLLGSLFGSHTSAAKDPDLYESQTGYGQDYANLQGTQIGTNGQEYTPSSQTAAFIAAEGVSNNGLGQTTAASNGTPISSGGVDAAEIWLSQQNPNSPPPGISQAAWSAQLAKWDAMFGSSATGAGQLSLRPGDPNIGDLEISGTGTSPIDTTYNQLGTALSAIESAAATAGSQTAVYGLSRTYPSFTSTLGAQEGTINSQTNAFTPAAGSVSGTGGSVTSGSGTASTPSTININIESLTGDLPASTITKMIQALHDASSNIVPGSTTLSLAQRP